MKRVILVLFLLLVPLATANIVLPEAGIYAYGEEDNQAPITRTWDGSLGNEQAALNVNGNIAWTVLAANHKRDELLLGTEDENEDINIQLFNGTWNSLLEVSTNAPDSNYRSFDIAYEQLSGTALIAYEKNTTSDSLIAYRTWNGSFSAEQYLNLNYNFGGETRWIKLIPQPRSNLILLIVQHQGTGTRRNLVVTPWNGTFDLTRQTSISTSTVSSTRQHFSFAWESLTNGGLLIYGEGNNLLYRHMNSNFIFETAQSLDLGNQLEGSRTCSDSTTDRIGLIWQDAGSDVGAALWNNGINFSSEDATTERAGTNTINVDCSFFTNGTALFGFINQNQQGISTFTYGTNWSISNLENSTTTNFTTEDIASMTFFKHPLSDQLMILTLDTEEDVHSLLWNNGFTNIGSIETELEVRDGRQDGATFTWFTYDPPPTILLPTISPYNLASAINLNATITDNIQVSTATATITLPNSTNVVQVMTANGNTYETSFSHTNQLGNYTFTVTANDTSSHANSNSSSTTFVITDLEAPLITLQTPAAGSSTLTSHTFSFLATDNYAQQFNCSLLFNNQTTTFNVTNGTSISTDRSNIALGTYNWNVNCTDTYNNTRIETRTLTISEAPSSSDSGGGGGGGGGGRSSSSSSSSSISSRVTPLATSTPVSGELAYPVNTLAMTRGLQEGVPFSITNNYNSRVSNLKIEPTGNYAPYFTLLPETESTTLEQGQTKQYSIQSNNPPANEDEIRLVLKVTGTLANGKTIEDYETVTINLKNPEQQPLLNEIISEETSSPRWIWIVLLILILGGTYYFFYYTLVGLTYQIERLGTKEQHHREKAFKTGNDKHTNKYHKIREKRLHLLQRRDKFLKN